MCPAVVKIEVVMGTANAERDIDKLVGKLSGFKAFSSAFGSAQTQAFGAAALGAMAFAKGLELVGQGFNAVKTYAEEAVTKFAAFNNEMYLLSALMEEGSNSVFDLSTAVKEASSNSVYSIMEMAGAYKTLAAMGYDTQASIEAMLPVWSQLAAITGTDLNQAVTVATQAFRVFKQEGLSASEVADILFEANRQGTLTIYDIGTALQYVGSMATRCSLTLAETSGMLAILSNRGFTASTAGTGLRAMFTAMLDPTDDAKKAMFDLGITIYNTDGSMRNMEDVINDLYLATENMTNEQRDMYMVSMFGRNALSTITALFGFMADEGDNASGAIDRFTDGLASSGQVLTQYEKYIQSFGAIMEKVQHAWEAFQVGIGENIIAGATSSFNEASTAVGGLVMNGDGFTAVFKLVGEVLGALAVVLVEVARYFNNVLINAQPLLQLLAGGLKVALIAVGIAFDALNNFMEDNRTAMVILTTALGIYVGWLISEYVYAGLCFIAETALNAVRVLGNGVIVAAAAVYAGLTGAKVADTLATWNLTAAQTAFDASLLACPITWIVLAFAAWALVLGAVWDKFKSLDAILTAINDKLFNQGDIIKQVISAIELLFAPLLLFIDLLNDPEPCLLVSLKTDTKAMQAFNKEIGNMGRTIDVNANPSLMSMDNQLSGGGMGGIGGGGGSTANTVNITVQGDIRDEATIRRVEREINRSSRGMFTG